MALLKTAEEIRAYMQVDGSFDPKSLIPYLHQASNEIKRLLGKAQYDALEAYYESNENADEALDALLPHVQRPMVYFAFLKGFDVFNINISNTGFTTAQSANLVPASRERTEALRKNMIEMAWDAMEDMLIFLEENIDDYDDWKSSEAYAMQYNLLITSARRFDELHRINRSRLTFLEWRPVMFDIESLSISPIVSTDVLTELKEEAQDGSMSDENKVIYEMLQKALAYLTAFEKGEETMKTKGNYYLNAAKQHMDQNIDDYPTYAASSAYISTQTSYKRYENTSDSHLAVF
jgi:hypothetical protein